MPNRKKIAILCAGGNAAQKRFMEQSDLVKLGMEYGNNK